MKGGGKKGVERGEGMIESEYAQQRESHRGKPGKGGKGSTDGGASYQERNGENSNIEKIEEAGA